MSWTEEFSSDYTPPAELLRLVSQGLADDMSWHNDAAPSFGLLFPDETVLRIMAHPENPDEREFPEWPRFMVWTDNADTELNVEHLNTDDVDDAIEAYKDALMPLLEKWPRPKVWNPRKRHPRKGS